MKMNQNKLNRTFKGTRVSGIWATKKYGRSKIVLEINSPHNPNMQFLLSLRQARTICNEIEKKLRKIKEDSND